jgi:hypothetical protein
VEVIVMRRTLAAAVVGLALCLVAAAQEREPIPEQVKKDHEAFRDFLIANKLTGKWQGPPQRLDTEELRKAYPGRRFYYTFVSPPLPPGAALPELIEAHRKATQEYLKRSLRVSVAIDEQGKVTALREPADFQVGLMPVNNERDASLAAAAILSVAVPEQYPPSRVTVKELSVRGTGKGIVVSVSRKQGFDGSVEFDRFKRVTKVTKQMNYVQPVPPSAPPGLKDAPLPPAKE